MEDREEAMMAEIRRLRKVGLNLETEWHNFSMLANDFMMAVRNIRNRGYRKSASEWDNAFLVLCCAHSGENLNEKIKAAIRTMEKEYEGIKGDVK